jgi:hypothetical protein
MPVILVKGDMETEGPWSEVGTGQKAGAMRPYLKNKLKQKGLETWLKW